MITELNTEFVLIKIDPIRTFNGIQSFSELKNINKIRRSRKVHSFPNSISVESISLHGLAITKYDM